jgi:hypothetical protein
MLATFGRFDRGREFFAVGPGLKGWENSLGT